MEARNEVIHNISQQSLLGERIDFSPSSPHYRIPHRVTVDVYPPLLEDQTSPIIGGSTTSVFVPFHKHRKVKTFEITRNHPPIWKHLSKIFTFCSNCKDREDNDDEGEEGLNSILLAKDERVVHVIRPSCDDRVSFPGLSQYADKHNVNPSKFLWKTEEEERNSTTPSPISFSLSSSLSSSLSTTISTPTSSPTSSPPITPPPTTAPKNLLPRSGRPPLIKNRIISASSSCRQIPSSTTSLSSTCKSNFSQHRRTDSDFEFSVSRLQQICREPSTPKIKEVHCRDISNVSPLMDEVDSRARAMTKQKDCTPIKKMDRKNSFRRKFIFEFGGDLEGLNRSLFGKEEEETRESNWKRKDEIRRELRDECCGEEFEGKNIPFVRKNKKRQTHGEQRMNINQPKLTSLTENGIYLPTCSLFLKYLRTKGIKGRCIFEGWVAFFLGDESLEKIKKSKYIRRSDVRYVLIVNEQQPILYAFTSPDVTDRKNDTITIDLSRGISMESWSMTKRKGQCVVVRDAKSDRVLCYLLPISLPPVFFVDSSYSRLINDQTYTKFQESILSPTTSSKNNTRKMRQADSKPSACSLDNKHPVWGDPEYLLKFAPVAQHEAATYILFSVSAIVRKG